MLCERGEWVCIQRHRESWRSHAFHAGTHRHIYHCAKGQRLMAISHPCLVSRAMTLSCWLSQALLTTKLPLCKPSQKVLCIVSLHLHLQSRGLTRRKNAEEGGKELAGASGSQWQWLKTKNSTCGNRTPWYVVLPLHGTRTPWARMHASTQATVYTRCWRGQGSHWRWESSIPLSVFTVFKVGAQSTCLSGGWLNEWHNKKWNN